MDPECSEGDVRLVGGSKKNEGIELKFVLVVHGLMYVLISGRTMMLK